MSPRRALALTLSASLALAGTVFATVPVAASCLPLSDRLPAADDPFVAVFVGTVTEVVEPAVTELAVDQWFAGEGPTDLVLVTGGRDPQTITSADWMPAPGQQYVVVATGSASGAFETAVCQQQRVDPPLMTELVARYGDPALPPFDAAAPRSPGSSCPATEVPSASEAPPIATSADDAEPGSLVHDVEGTAGSADAETCPNASQSQMPTDG